MRRREFIAIATGAACWPLVAGAQQSGMLRIGFLGPGTAQLDAYRVTAFLRGLGEAGYIEGQNVAIEYVWADGRYDRLPALAADLVRKNVSLIVATSTPSVLAAKSATATIPIVFEAASDPVKLGLVASLARPGGNVTGVTQATEEVMPKRLQLMRELIPEARVMGLLVNPADPILAEPQAREALSVSRDLGIELHVLNASTGRDLDTAFAKLTEISARGLIIGGDAFFTSRSRELAALAVEHAMPATYQWREFVAAGGLMSYGSSITETHRIVGIYAGRILKGDKPADLPVQQATKFELYINLKTAKALGLTIPLSLLGRADEVIE